MKGDISNITSITGNPGDGTITFGPDHTISTNNGKITNLAEGTNANDAINKGQLDKGLKDKVKKDLTNIEPGGKTVIKEIAKDAVQLEDGSGTKVSHRTDDTKKVEIWKVDVKGALSNITSITGNTGSSTVTFNNNNNTVNFGGGRITNIDKGVNGKDAINKGQLEGFKQTLDDSKANKNLDNIDQAGETVIKKLAQEAVTLENGQNTTVSSRDKDGNKIWKVDLNDTLTNMDSISGKNGGKISFDGNNINVNNGKITNVEDGVNPDDAVNKGQLDKEVKTINDELNKKANKNFDNIDDAGKNVIKNLSVNAVKVEDGKNTTVRSVKNADNTEVTYHVDVNDKMVDINSIEGKQGGKIEFGGANGENQIGFNNGKIIHIANATENDDAIAYGQLKAVEQKAKDNAVDISNKADVDLNNIDSAGEKVILNLAKKAVELENGMNTTVSSRDDGDKTVWKVDVKGDLKDIDSIKGSNGSKVDFGTDHVNFNDTKLSGVADGVADNDVATVGQLKDKADVDAGNIDPDTWREKLGIQGLDANAINEQIAQVGAHSAALAALKPLTYNPMEKTQLMAGIGRYKAKNAVALGIAVHANENLMFNGGISMAKGSTMMANAGITWRIGTPEQQNAKGILKDGPITAMYHIADDMDSLEGKVSYLEEDNNSLLAENQELSEDIEILRQQISQLIG